MAKLKSTKSNTAIDNTDSLFANSEVQERQSHLPDGTYQGFVVPGSAKMEERTSKAGNTSWNVSMQLKVLNGDYVNRTQWYRQNLGTEVGVNIFVTDLVNMGFEKPSSKREAAECLAETDNVKVSFWVNHKDDGYAPTVRINELLEDDDVEGATKESDGAVEGNDVISREDVLALGNAEDEAGLQEIIDEYGLDINQDDYETYGEVATEIVGQLKL